MLNLGIICRSATILSFPQINAPLVLRKVRDNLECGASISPLDYFAPELR